LHDYKLYKFSFSLNGFTITELGLCSVFRDVLIEQLMREIVELKERIANLEGQIQADHTLMAGLRSRLQQLEAELNDYKEIAEQTCNVCVFTLEVLVGF
jgi:hypothetical protein